MELEFISERYSLYHLEHFFCYLMEGINVDYTLKHKIRLCFQEAVTNAVSHANQYDDSKKVQIQLLPTDTELILTVRDEGMGFDMEEILNPTRTENLSKQGGRGIFLIKEYSTSCSYLQEEKKLIMKFNLKS